MAKTFIHTFLRGRNVGEIAFSIRLKYDVTSNGQYFDWRGALDIIVGIGILLPQLPAAVSSSRAPRWPVIFLALAGNFQFILSGCFAKLCYGSPWGGKMVCVHQLSGILKHIYAVGKVGSGKETEVGLPLSYLQFFQLWVYFQLYFQNMSCFNI